jgi:NADPH2:quinone reductase
VLHFAGDATALLPAVRQDGLLVSTLIGSGDQVPTHNATVVSIYANPDGATLDRCADNHVQQHTRLHIQRTYRLEDTPVALADYVGGTLGKLVITMD